MRFLAARGFDADVIRHVVAASDDEFAPEPSSDAPPAGSPDHEDA